MGLHLWYLIQHEVLSLDDWNAHVGKDGDWTRKNITDQIVWRYLGEIKDKVILDAGKVNLVLLLKGCGNGYMIPKLIEKGAKSVFALDSSTKMLEMAKQNVSQWVSEENLKKVGGRFPHAHSSDSLCP